MRRLGSMVDRGPTILDVTCIWGKSMTFAYLLTSRLGFINSKMSMIIPTIPYSEIQMKSHSLTLSLCSKMFLCYMTPWSPEDRASGNASLFPVTTRNSWRTPKSSFLVSSYFFCPHLLHPQEPVPFLKGKGCRTHPQLLPGRVKVLRQQSHDKINHLI